MGASGSGKSTLMNTSGVWINHERRIFFDGQAVAGLNRKELAKCATGNWFCFSKLQSPRRTSALENVELPMFTAIR